MRRAARAPARSTRTQPPQGPWTCWKKAGCSSRLAACVGGRSTSSSSEEARMEMRPPPASPAPALIAPHHGGAALQRPPDSGVHGLQPRASARKTARTPLGSTLQVLMHAYCAAHIEQRTMMHGGVRLQRGRRERIAPAADAVPLEVGKQLFGTFGLVWIHIK